MNDTAWIPGFTSYLEEEVQPSPRTMRSYLGVAKRIVASGATPHDWLQQYLGAPKGTLTAYRPAARWLWRYMRDLGEEVGPDPTIRIRKVEDVAPEGLDDATLDRYYDLVDAMDEPHRSILRLLPRTGLRISEACALRVEEIRKDEHRWALRVTGKGPGGMEAGGGKLRWVPLSTNAQRDLAAYLEESELFGIDSPWVFPSPASDGPYTPDAVRKAWRGVRDHLGQSDLTPHVLRHTFAHRFLEKHGYTALPALQTILGHSDMATTRRYAKESRTQLHDLMEGMD